MQKQKNNEVSAPVPGLVSVILGAYDIAPLLQQTLDSVLAQRHVQLEIIVVDDGSTDGTGAVLESYGDRIRAVTQANGGVAAARNTGLKHARGEFIALMDHDDLCMPERLAVQMACLRALPQVSLCCSEFSGFSEEGPIADAYSGHYYAKCDEASGGTAGHYSHRHVLDIGACLSDGKAPHSSATTTVFWGEVYEDIACGNFVHPPTVMFRASLLAQVGEFDPTAGLMCDWEWLVRAARYTPFASIDRPLLNYRRSAGQISSPRYHRSALVDMLAVAESIARRDPSLWQRQPEALKANLVDITMDVADANAEVNASVALRLLARLAWRYRVVTTKTLRILVKALIPGWLLRKMRGLRGGSKTAAG
jgi:glycosyltransferase involved in cell wall biosynthesis